LSAAVFLALGETIRDEGHEADENLTDGTNLALKVEFNA
jgi:hypothetical protein